MTSNNYIDLHLHSRVSSDGDLSPKDLMNRCRAAGLEIISLADHNSLTGIQEARIAARELGLIFIPGIELDCSFKGTNLHLLGYHVDDRFGWFEKNNRALEDQERTASQIRVDAVRALGIFLNDESLAELSIRGIITGEMIAEAALGDPKNNGCSILDPYRPEGARSQNPFVNFYWDFCAQGKPAYAPIQFPDLTEAVDAVKSSGGTTVLAHPGANIGRDGDLFRQIISRGVQGVEVFSSYHDKETTEFYYDLARKTDRLMTVGSDFHGKTKPAIQLGKTDCTCQNEIAAWITGLFYTASY